VFAGVFSPQWDKPVGRDRACGLWLSSRCVSSCVLCVPSLSGRRH